MVPPAVRFCAALRPCETAEKSRSMSNLPGGADQLFAPASQIMSSAEATPYFLNAVAAVSVIDLLQLSALEQSDSDEESSSPSTEPTTPTSSTFSSSSSGGHSNAMAEMMLDPSEGVGAESDEPVPATDEVSDEVRLERLVKEFGSWCDESERYQTQIPGACTGELQQC